MVEMIADGGNGWLAKTAKRSDLQSALKRALETPPGRIAEMGEEAAKHMRKLCDPGEIVDKHLSFRRRIVAQGVKRSLDPSLDSLPGGGGAFCNAPANIYEKLVVRRPEPIAQDVLTSPATASDSGWYSKLHEPLATVRCLLGNPRIFFRVFQQLTAEWTLRNKKPVASELLRDSSFTFRHAQREQRKT
jgi:hypothetical protein